MLFSPNFAAYINPGPGLKQYDFGSGFRALAQQALQQKSHEDQVAHENRVADDLNARYALSLGEQRNARQFEVDKEHYLRAEKAVGDARAAAAAGRWNQVEGMLGTLADLGVSVDKQMDANGMPVYRFQNNTPQYHTGETYESAIGKLNGHPNTATPDRSQQDVQYHEVHTNVNPYDALPGVSAAYVAPQTQVQQPQQPSGHFDPNTISTAQINQMNAQRLDPVLAGIQSAYPSQYQGLIGNFLSPLKGLGFSPEGTLEVAQKPLETITSLYRAQEANQGATARAAMSQGGAASSEARLRQESAQNHAIRIATQYEIPNNLETIQNFDLIRQQINSGNPNMVANGIKQIIAMTDGHRITDQDFQIGVRGLASSLTDLSNNIQRIYVDGLNPAQVRNFNMMLDAAKGKIEKSLRFGMAQLSKYANSQRYEPERLGVRSYLQSLPPQYLPPDAQNFDPTAEQGGLPVRTQVATKKSASASAPTPQQAVDATKDEFDEFR